MDEKFENQQSSFSAIAKDICSTVFESLWKLLRNKWKNKVRDYQSWKLIRVCFRNRWWVWSMQIFKCKITRKNQIQNTTLFNKALIFDGFKSKWSLCSVRWNNLIRKRNASWGWIEYPPLLQLTEYSDYKRNKKCNAIIVRFTTFVYRARKNQKQC